MPRPAARLGDMHTCPMFDGEVPHVGGPISLGAMRVLINGQPAARIGDMAICIGPPDAIASGAGNVLISGSPAARLGDSTEHGGVVVMGSHSVFITEGGGSGEIGGIEPPTGSACLRKAAAAGSPFVRGG